MNSRTGLALNTPTGRTEGIDESSLRSLVVPIYAALCFISLIPFVFIEHPPIVDFANHAARLFLACNSTNAVVAEMYHYRLGIIPNLAVDVINLPLCDVVAPATVLKCVTVGALLLIYWSAWLIQRKLFGHATPFLFALPAISLNLVTTMGYINFLVGAAFAMLLIALAVGHEHRLKSLALLCNIGGLLIFFCHIFALAFAILLLFGLLLGRAPFTRRHFVEAALQTAVFFAAPLALAVLVPSDGQGLAIDYLGKIRILVAPFLAQHTGVGIFGIVFVAPLYLLIRNRLVAINRSLHWPLMTVAAYVLVVPSGIQDAVDIDSRTLVVLTYLFFASLDPVRQSQKAFAALLACSALMVAIELWGAFSFWQPFSREVAELRQASAALPPQAKVLSVTEAEGENPTGAAFPFAYSHLASYATIDRLIFNPLEFTGRGMQPLSVTAEYAALDTPAALPFRTRTALELENPTLRLEGRARRSNAEFALRWPQTFDYVIYYHFGHRPNFDPATLSEVRRGSFFSILKVRR